MPTPLPLPLWCTELELGAPLPERLCAPDDRYRSVRVLLRLHGDALGYTALPLADGSVNILALLAAAGDDVRALAAGHLAAEGLALATGGALGGLVTAPEANASCPTRPLEEGPLVTVAVCTRGRGEALRSCLARLERLTYPHLEVLIVDNAPVDDSTRTVFDAAVGHDPRFRYTVEPRPGLSWARNCAVGEARGELLAYTDDDVEVDPGWIDGLVRGFARSESVGCVTGLVCSASVDGPVEAYFDGRTSWGDSCEPRRLSLARDSHDGLFPYSAGVFGTGASFAFRTELIRSLGGFDVALGAGTRAAGGEDLDAFVRVVLAGYEVAYEPSALVWHHHRSDLAGLDRQMFAYGSGLTAFLFKHLLDPITRRGVLRRVPTGVRKMVAIPGATFAAGASVQALDAGASDVRPGRLLVREFLGMFAGPVLYLRSRAVGRVLASVPVRPTRPVGGEIAGGATIPAQRFGAEVAAEMADEAGPR
jgi:GT2 family glycosyltransferase